MNDIARIDSSTAPVAGHFPTTRLSLVQQASHGDPETAARAIRELCAIYHEPIRNWLARNLPQVRERDDVVQGFLEYLLQQNRFRSYQWGAAKFRSFLIKCLKWYLRGEHRKAEGLLACKSCARSSLATPRTRCPRLKSPTASG